MCNLPCSPGRWYNCKLLPRRAVTIVDVPVGTVEILVVDTQAPGYKGVMLEVPFQPYLEKGQPEAHTVWKIAWVHVTCDSECRRRI
jgi:hypothetical protein